MNSKTSMNLCAAACALLLATACQLSGPKPPATSADEEALRLIEAGADLNAPLDETGATALHRVAAAGTPPVARALMDAGADPNLPALPTTQPVQARGRTFATAASSDDDCDGYYEINQPVVFKEGYCHVYAYGPLHYAARRNSRSEMIQTLIDGGADPDARGYRHTPLHEAVWREDAAQIIRALIGGGTDPNRGRDHYDQHPDGIKKGNNTPLCWATHAQHEQATVEATMQALLDGGASLLRGDTDGKGTALHCAAWYDATPATVRFLVEAANKAGIDDFVNRLNNRRTALCDAAQTENGLFRNLTPNSEGANALALVRTLLDLGADPNGIGPSVRVNGEVRSDRDHPLLCAVRGRGHAVTLGIDPEHYDTIIEVLLAAGAVWPEGYEPSASP